jgi:phosphoribosylformylglycinamidine (FGAM) synthase PurS component
VKLDIAIEPIIPDNTAFTVLTALRDLGYAELRAVERADHVFLEAPAESDPRSLAAQVSRAEVLFNPNKHRMRIASEDGDAATSGAEFEALVRDKDEENGRLLGTLGSTFGIKGLSTLERAVAWRLIEESGTASPDRLDWACRALLANPVSQLYWIRPRPVYSAVRPENR